MAQFVPEDVDVTSTTPKANDKGLLMMKSPQAQENRVSYFQTVKDKLRVAEIILVSGDFNRIWTFRTKFFTALRELQRVLMGEPEYLRNAIRKTYLEMGYLFDCASEQQRAPYAFVEPTALFYTMYKLIVARINRKDQSTNMTDVEVELMDAINEVADTRRRCSQPIYMFTRNRVVKAGESNGTILSFLNEDSKIGENGSNVDAFLSILNDD